MTASSSAETREHDSEHARMLTASPAPRKARWAQRAGNAPQDKGIPITATAIVPGCTVSRCTARVQLQPRHCLKRYNGLCRVTDTKNGTSSGRPLHTHPPTCSQGSAAEPGLHTAAGRHMKLPLLLRHCTDKQPQAQAVQHTMALAPQSSEASARQRKRNPPTCLPMHQPKDMRLQNRPERMPDWARRARENCGGDNRTTVHA